MSQQKELMYGTAISITAERALKHYLQMTEEKDEKKFYVSLFFDITSDEFREGKFKRKIKGKEEELYVRDVIYNAIISVVGCDEDLRKELQKKIHQYRTAVINTHEGKELENLKNDLDELFDQCLGNDRKIDMDEFRNNISIFFNFVDLFKVKKNVDITQRVDESIKRMKEEARSPISDKKGT